MAVKMSIDVRRYPKPDLPYRYEFSPDELSEVKTCVEAHGFAIVKQVLTAELVEQLKAAVAAVLDPKGDMPQGESGSHLSFVEATPVMWKLLEHEPFMRMARCTCAAEALTINRSAAILRKPGSAVVGWHTDWRGWAHTPPVNPGTVLNRGAEPSGLWFYLTGSRPMHGGLCVIADSHREDWPGPAGFDLTEDRTSFVRREKSRDDLTPFDVPGLVPLYTDRADLIVFAHRTYHAAFPNQADEVRLSCAIGFRNRATRTDAPWALPDSARKFMDELPERLKEYVDGYTGFDGSWKAQM